MRPRTGSASRSSSNRRRARTATKRNGCARIQRYSRIGAQFDRHTAPDRCLIAHNFSYRDADPDAASSHQRGRLRRDFQARQAVFDR